MDEVQPSQPTSAVKDRMSLPDLLPVAFVSLRDWGDQPDFQKVVV